MVLEIESVTQACNAISQQVKDDFRELTLHYIVHHEGQRMEALGLAGQEVLYHPAAETALQLLKNRNRPMNIPRKSASPWRRKAFSWAWPAVIPFLECFQ